MILFCFLFILLLLTFETCRIKPTSPSPQKSCEPRHRTCLSESPPSFPCSLTPWVNKTLMFETIDQQDKHLRDHRSTRQTTLRPPTNKTNNFETTNQQDKQLWDHRQTRQTALRLSTIRQTTSPTGSGQQQQFSTRPNQKDTLDLRRFSNFSLCGAFVKKKNTLSVITSYHLAMSILTLKCHFESLDMVNFFFLRHFEAICNCLTSTIYFN